MARSKSTVGAGRIPSRSLFHPEAADPDGLVAVGGSLHPDLLLEAYRSGVFPWSSRPLVSWWSPDPRALFDLASFRVPKRLTRTIRRRGWLFSLDQAFEEVMHGCAASAPGREGTWITEDFIDAYSSLHRRGFAHSFEVWNGEKLTGGLYGVSIGSFFGGESMFRRETDASKAALAYAISELRQAGFTLFDAQVPTPHLQRMGAIRVPRIVYLERLQRALGLEATIRPTPPKPFRCG